MGCYHLTGFTLRPNCEPNWKNTPCKDSPFFSLRRLRRVLIYCIAHCSSLASLFMISGVGKHRRFGLRGFEDCPASIWFRVLCTMKDQVLDELPVLQPIETKNGQQCYSSKVQATPDIEKKYVHRVYDAIAPHFSATRFAKWPKVQAFLNSLPSGSLVLDAGCGNGKYLGLNPNCFFIGCDISSPLINICADKGQEVLVADAVNLPYRSAFGDAAISIAVLHHLSTESRRMKAVEELIRVVKTGGLVLITVWAREQEDESLLNKWTPLTQKYSEEWIGPGSPQIRKPSTPRSLDIIPEESTEERSNGDLSSCQQEYFVPWHLPYHRAEVSGASANAVATGLARKDDKKCAVVYDRYYHVFSEGELERLASCVDVGAIVVDKFYDKSNWCIILEKTSS